jgi:DNA-binding MarR family transcriptional regulator
VRRRDTADDKDRSRGDRADRRAFVIEEGLGYLVNRAARTMAQQLAEELRPTGVGIGQWAVLLFLWAGDGLTQAELSRVVAIEPPTMVRTIDRMVRDGLVERRRDRSDARVSRIYLTPRGRSLRDELIPKAAAVNRRILASMTPAEARTVRQVLARIIEDTAPRGSEGRRALSRERAGG